MAPRIENITDKMLAVIALGPLVGSDMARDLGLARFARVLIAAGVKLTIDLDGEAVAWAVLRDALAVATERARLASHPPPRPAA